MINGKTLNNIIDAVIQKELHYETDNITKEGWHFLENDAPALIKAKIKENFDFDGEVIDKNSSHRELISGYVDNILQTVINDYEDSHPPIRSYKEY